MNLQIIKSIDGKAEYVLLPFHIYNSLRNEIEKALKKKYNAENYVHLNLQIMSIIRLLWLVLMPESHKKPWLSRWMLPKLTLASLNHRKE